MTIRASRSALAALGLALAVTIAGTSYAQQRAPQPTPLPAPPQANQVQPAPNAGPDRQFDRQNGRQTNRRGDRLERRLDFLHYELRISQQQQRLWDQFAAALRDQAQSGRGAGGRGAQRNDRRQEGGSVLDRLEQRQERLADRSDRFDQLVGTLRPLYTALNAEQKRTADRLLFQAGNRSGRNGFNRGGRGSDRGRFGGRRFGQNDDPSGPEGFSTDEREYR